MEEPRPPSTVMKRERVPKRPGLPVWPVCGGRDAGGEGGELEDVASVEREIVDLLLVDDLADGGFGSLELRGECGDFDDFVGSADAEGEGDVGGLADLDVEGGDLAGLEAGLLYADGVVGGEAGSGQRSHRSRWWSPCARHR